MSPLTVTFPFATLVIVLYLLWSETVRRKTRTSLPVLVLRAALCAIAGGILAFNMVSYPFHFGAGNRWLSVLAITIAFGTSAFYVHRIRVGSSRPAAQVDDEPLPPIFPGRKDQDAGQAKSGR